MNKFALAVVLSSTLLLCACADTPDNGLLPPESIYPTALTTCPDDPVVPPRPAAGKPRTPQTQAEYLKNVHTAGEQCRAKVNGWKNLRDDYTKQYEQQNFGFFERLYRSVTDAAKTD